MKRFNAKRRLKVIDLNKIITLIANNLFLFFLQIKKGMILAAVSSDKWQQPIVDPDLSANADDDDEALIEQRRTYMNLEDQATSIGT